MKPVALIPARAGSRGIPGKNTMDFCGLPLIAWSIKQAIAAGLDTYVTTEDSVIASCAVAFKAKTITRPKELAADDTKMIDVVKDAVRQLPKYDAVILLQPTSPLRKKNDINTCYKLHVAGKSQYTATYYRLKMVKLNECVDCQIRQRLAVAQVVHGMIFIYNYNYEPIGERRISEIGGFETEEWQSHELDDPEDIEICEYYMRRRGLCII